ncbi:MAG: hypothetical protein M1835_007602 [Candelina submexicana]|nr:MAG: hypothetical protein M1835_007602 [Candelina submexicana]
MAPLRKFASRRSEKGSQMQEQTEIQQYGRTPSTLGAEVAAAALRPSGSVRSPPISPLPSRGASSTNLLRQQTTRSNSSRPTVEAPTSTPLTLQRRPSYAPAVSSPLNPASPTGSIKSRDSSPSSIERRESPRDGMTALSHTHSINAIGTAAPLGKPPVPPPRRGRAPSPEIQEDIPELRQPQSSPALRPQTPISLSDLGRDYSRYPFRGHSPYAGNRNSFSESVPQTPRPLSQHSRLIPAAAVPGAASSSNLLNPFSDSAAKLPGVEDQEKPFSSYHDSPYLDSLFLDDRVNAPTAFSAGYKFPMFLDEKEDDDDMHTPYPDDDIKLKPHWKDYFARDNFLSMLGLVVLVVGLAIIFVLVPVLSFTGHIRYTTPNQNSLKDLGLEPEAWAQVNNIKYPLFKNLRTGLIDPDTPKSAMTRAGVDGNDLELVFSDEFSKNNRTFYPGDDPYWTAPDFWYGATQDLEWYDPDAATTYKGTLKLQLDKFLNHNLQFRSGMLNSWNQVCFKGGALEVSLSLPGPAGKPGLWPGVWTMGNLGRPGYKASTEGLWPYTYNSCDAGITPNQSATDGMSFLPGQRLASCTCSGEDHPTPGTGRGAPEIDVIEASVDPNNRIGVVTQSYQVAPFDVWYHPNYDFLQIPNYATTQMNSYCGGPFQQALSGTTLLNNAWYDERQYQKYAFEYTPGTDNGEIAWYVGEDMSYMMKGKSIGPNGNIQSRQISEEPMSIILNLGISNAWTWIDWEELTFPTTFNIDYVRWYQKPGETSVTCDPEGYETTQYIKNHPAAYNNMNLTVSRFNIEN